MPFVDDYKLMNESNDVAFKAEAFCRDVWVTNFCL